MITSRINRPSKQRCMDACGGLSSLVYQDFKRILVFWIVLVTVSTVQVDGQSVVFTATPVAYTSSTSGTFRFNVLNGNGGDPCATQCSIQCKLDHDDYRNCSTRTYSYSKLSDGSHVFTVSVNISTTTHFTNAYSWTVDTVPPTASISVKSLYIHEVNITAFVTFSETCTTGGSFQCANTRSCALRVHGPGAVLPSTFAVVIPGLVYSVQVELSNFSPKGRVTLFTARKICADAAGNPYRRTSNSSITVRFSRGEPTVNVWTPIKNTQVFIGDQARTVHATRKSSDLVIYVDFDEPLLGTAAELQSLLTISHGILLPAHRRSQGNRRFAFSLTLNNTRTAVVTVTLPGNSTASQYGSPVLNTATVTFLYDVERPQVQLSSTSRAHLRNHLVPVVIQFTKPVFTFNNSGVTITGGMIRSFEEVTKTTYALVVYAEENGIVGISVAENQTLDVAGNSNTASSVLRFRHYSNTPAVSVALCSFITAGLLGTTLVSGALAVATANLAAAGALSAQTTTSCVGADPSRNLMGMASHMQVLALSSFLAVSLPIEYFETANGLQWLIPYINTPWQKDEASNYTSFGSNVETNLTLNIRRALLTTDLILPGPSELQTFYSGCGNKWHTQHSVLDCVPYTQRLATPYLCGVYLEEYLLLQEYDDEDQELSDCGLQGRRQLGSNGTELGPAVMAAEYGTYFLNHDLNLRRLRDALNASNYTGWSDFQRSLFWLAVVVGTLFFLHAITLLFIRWRTRTPMHGTLSIPRFELFLLILALPAICQASAFIIRGNTTAGIVVGALLFIIPALLVFNVALILIFSIFLRRRVQYKEFRPQLQRDGHIPPPPTRIPMSLITGPGYKGKWAKKEIAGLAFIPKYGILFEDRKGPPRLVTMDDGTISGKDIGPNGLRRISAMNSDDEQEEVAVSRPYTVLGCFQSAYISVDILRRIALGLVFGAIPLSDKSWAQTILVLAMTVIQLCYLVIIKPFRRRGVQLVETVSLSCEIGIFIAAMVILAKGRPWEDYFGIGIFMLVLFVLSFVAQSANEWFALIRQLLALSNREEVSPKLSLERFVVGLVLPLLPRSRWPQFAVESSRTNLRSLEPTVTPEPLKIDTRLRTSKGQFNSSSGSSKVGSGNPVKSPRSPIFAGATTSKKPTPSTKYWPGQDLQEWARQNSLERNRQETELVANPLVAYPMIQENTLADTISKSTLEVSDSTGVSRSGQRLSRIHSSDSLSDLPSDGDFSIDVTQEFTHPTAPAL